MSQKNIQRRNRGFTLTEMAIVLGVIGLILGAIWVAAADAPIAVKSPQPIP